MNQQQQYVQPQMQQQPVAPAPQQQYAAPQPVQPEPQIQQPAGGVFDEGESVVTTGSSGLTMEHGTKYAVVWGIVTYPGWDFNDKSKVVDKKLIVVQFPADLDDKGKPQVGIVFANSSFNPKSNLHKWIKEIFGRSIGSEDPLRLPNGNLDTTKITGVNCLAVVGNVSKTEGETKTGILSFAKPMPGSQQFQLDTTMPIPEFIVELKNGKEIKSRQQMPPAGAPTIPQVQQQPTPPPQQIAPTPQVQNVPQQPPAPAPVQPPQPVQQQPVPNVPAPSEPVAPQGVQQPPQPVQPQQVAQQPAAPQGVQQATQGMLQANAINF